MNQDAEVATPVSLPMLSAIWTACRRTDLLSPSEVLLLLELQTKSTHATARRRGCSQPTIHRAARKILEKLKAARPEVHLSLLCRRPAQISFTSTSRSDYLELLDHGLEWETVANPSRRRCRPMGRRAYARQARSGC